MKTDEIYFDYWCPECKNYVLLEKSKDMLEGNCALCGLKISISCKKYFEVYKTTTGITIKREGGKS